jgi:hypothetical protein
MWDREKREYESKPESGVAPSWVYPAARLGWEGNRSGGSQIDMTARDAESPLPNTRSRVTSPRRALTIWSLMRFPSSSIVLILLCGCQRAPVSRRRRRRRLCPSCPSCPNSHSSPRIADDLIWKVELTSQYLLSDQLQPIRTTVRPSRVVITIRRSPRRWRTHRWW